MQQVGRAQGGLTGLAMGEWALAVGQKRGEIGTTELTALADGDF
jgi:hypothetical protein